MPSKTVGAARKAGGVRRSGCRNLVVVPGDQLDRHSAAFDGFQPDRDRIWMAEAAREATHVWCHQQRLVFFFAAMRHLRDDLRQRGWAVDYHELGPDPATDRGGSMEELLAEDVRRLRPERVVLLRPGDWRVMREIETAVQPVPLEYRSDRHFYLEPEAFQVWASGRKSLVLEHFYRWMRQQFGILVDEQGRPAGGSWNYDRENREPFPRSGPEVAAPRQGFPPDPLTRQVMEMVGRRFAGHPGSVDGFDWPVTPEQAAGELEAFIRCRLPLFGRYQDAMWSGEPVLFHSRLSAVMNVRLLDPRTAVDAAVSAWEQGRAPLNSVEAFVRQILGWREFVRGVYWHFMPRYAGLNALQCAEDAGVPAAFWTGESDMNCIHEAMRSVIDGAYGHHIHRLMVLGLYAQLLGVHPRLFHEWHMAMYADAVDWVSLPNTLGMSQWGDGGIMATKPYCASGNYIQRMSNYCANCQYDWRQASGPRACPVTALYWDFLDRHRGQFAGNGRMLYQLRNLERKTPAELEAIRATARQRRRQELRRESPMPGDG